MKTMFKRLATLALLAVTLAASPLAQCLAAGESGSRAIAPANEQSVARELAQQRKLLREAKAEYDRLPPLPPYSQNEPQEIRDQRKRRSDMLEGLMEIEGRLNEVSNVRTVFLSERSRSASLREYYQRISERIEQHGTKNFPKHGDESLYGRVHLLVTLRADGRIAKIDVIESTSRVLSAHSVKLLRELEPFERFPPDVARVADRVVIGSPFIFTKE
jgi:outer membrane biosynthesis protein TonB